ncbi:MAG TPA: NUDIX hydrolase [Treponemataceae bacterium]|nr:NUDIX hydrolase [Treponemataceae bacterium]
MPDDLKWKPIERKNVFSTRVFDIHEITSQSPDSRNEIFYSLHAGDWVIVIPVLKNKNGKDSFLMVTQWRHGSESLSIEFPGGVIDEGENPTQAAMRELVEETGYTAGNLSLAGKLSPNPAIMDNQCHIFIAENLLNTHHLDLDDNEYLSSQAMDISEVFSSMGHGSFRHGLMSAALLLYVQKKGLPADFTL